MGRVTYEAMAGLWPTSTAEYAKPMNEIPKVVFSTTFGRAEWPTTTTARGDLALGRGEPMFKDLSVERCLELIEAPPYPDGTIISVCRPRRECV